MEKFMKYAKEGLQSQISELKASLRGYQRDLKDLPMQKEFIEEQILRLEKEIELKESEMEELKSIIKDL